ncbi:hypothetical protein J3R30DRAFT_3694217 [Lentinula aciculospora]|uniref:DUF6534 domain-containing protein n=1 Tax=Lentinula aciculospora TaxID=153920 RepID=A0A9W9AW49_9AGAR|nr:hypothetical protein J3R30DRAFT_3694217 [Lentinula aciculospora]
MSDLNSTVGALEIGNVLATYFFGIITLQTYFFFRTFPDDKPLVKAAVAVVFAFELGHTITSLHALYIVTVTDFGQPQLFVKLPNSIDITLLFEGLITIVVQGFFITRVQRLSKIHKIIIYLFWICAILRFAASVALTVFGIQTPSATAYVADWSWLLTTLFTLGAFVDLGVALALCAYLYSQRATSIAKTGILLDRLIAFTLTTGLLTSVVSVVTVISYVTMPDNSVWILMYTLLAKSYSNSMMVSLNSRPALKGSSGSNVITLSTMIGGSVNQPVHGNSRRPNFQSTHSDEDENHPVSISQVVETRTDSDDIFPPQKGNFKFAVEA